MKSPFLVDTTLRDGMQAPGISLALNYRLSLADRLIDAGFKELEAGVPAVGNDDIRILRHVRDRSVRSIAWCRALDSDIGASERAGTGAVHIAMPMSLRLRRVVGWNGRELPDRIESLVTSALIGHSHVSVGFMDCFRSDTGELAAMVRVALDCGAHRVRLADSVGLGTPARVRELASDLGHRNLDVIEFHGHDDLGMALANGLEALDCGFGGLSGTVAGIGERAGNLAWERLAVLRRDSGYPDARTMVELAVDLYREAGREIPGRTPVLGKYCRLHESGIHTAAHFRDAGAFMPWDPADFGLGSAAVVAGSSSGRGGLAGMLKTRGIQATTEELDAVLVEVKRICASGGGSLTAAELADIYTRLMEQSA